MTFETAYLYVINYPYRYSYRLMEKLVVSGSGAGSVVSSGTVSCFNDTGAVAL